MIYVNVYRTNIFGLAYTANFETLADAESFAAEINSNNHLFARVYVV